MQPFQHGAHFLVRLIPHYEWETVRVGHGIWLRPTPIPVIVSLWHNPVFRLVYLPTGGNVRILENAETLERQHEVLYLDGREFELQQIRWVHLVPWIWEAFIYGTMWPWRWTWSDDIENSS